MTNFVSFDGRKVIVMTSADDFFEDLGLTVLVFSFFAIALPSGLRPRDLRDGGRVLDCGGFVMFDDYLLIRGMRREWWI